MGQTQSGPKGARNISTEQLSHELAVRFAKRCFTKLELYSFKDVFQSLADIQSNLHYWREDTFCRFLEIPDALRVGSVLYHSATYLGAFPFPNLAPSILGFEALLKVIVIMTERYNRVLKKGNADRMRLLFRSLAVFDRAIVDSSKESEHWAEAPSSDASEKAQAKEVTHHLGGFTIDEPQSDDDDENDDDDQLTLAVLESLDVTEVFKGDEKSRIHQARIPADDFRQLLMLLLVIAPLQTQESLSNHADRFRGEQLTDLQRTADNILWAFDVEKNSGVLYHDYNSITSNSLPYLFDGLNPLFEHFLFSKRVDFSHSKAANEKYPSGHESSSHKVPDPLLLREGDILNLNVLGQLSFFIRGSDLFRRLRSLYVGSDAGFSLGSFETKILKWQAPTLLLVAGTRLPLTPENSRQRAFADTLPSKRFPDGAKGNHKEDRVVFGAYIPSPWKITHKECFGDPSTLLFQLEPIHEVFRASTLNHDYVSLTKPSALHTGGGTGVGGVSFGSPIPTTTKSASSIFLGPVSLSLDSSLEFGVFTHDIEAGSGSFQHSGSRRSSWQERFEVESLEVWGFGGDEEAKRQSEAWAFEEREAQLRRQVNLGKDVEMDRALLELAGLVGGHNRSGGSV